MTPGDLRRYPPCAVDYPPDFDAEELAAHAAAVNTLLKSSYLAQAPAELESALQSLFDAAALIAGAEVCACLTVEAPEAGLEAAALRGTAPPDGQRALWLVPALLCRHHDKAVLLDSLAEPTFAPVCRLWGADSVAAFPLRRDREFLGAFVCGRRGVFTPPLVKLLWVLAMQAEAHLVRDEAVKTLVFYSFIDPLTHLHNRRYFDEQLEKEIVRSRRNGKPLSVVLVDLDGFKDYNDRFLHAAGDIALQEVGAILRDSVREVDTVARLGGDEFALLLEETGADGARDLARRILDRLGRHLFPGAEGKRAERLSASMGIASFPADAFGREDLIRKADQALYAAKEQGTGRVCLFQDLGDLLAALAEPRDIPLGKLYEATRSVVDMDKFLEILLFTAMQGLRAERGSIAVPREDGTYLLRAAVGFGNGGNQRLAAGSIVPPGGVTSWVAETRRPLVVRNSSDCPVPRTPRRNGYRSLSFLSVPLVHEGRLVGIINLTDRRGGEPFTSADLEAFGPVAARIASLLAEGLRFRDNARRLVTTVMGSLTEALELRLPFFAGHGERVRLLSVRAGRALGLHEPDLAVLDAAGALHDVGFAGIPARILAKAHRLDDRELEIVHKHPLIGFKILENAPDMDAVRQAVLQHHERYDGKGYPRGLRGEEICLAARIVHAADFYDAITSERPHRGAISRGEALQMIRNGAGRAFDPAVARAFVEDPSVTAPGNASSRAS